MTAENGGLGPREAGDDGRLAQAISELAKALKPPPAAPSGSRAGRFLLKALETLAPSVVMFALGYIFIQGVELDLKREQFTATAADKVKTYVERLITADSSTSTASLRATALALGGFGGVAAIPLLSVVEVGGARRIDSAKIGLEQAGRIAPERVCGVLAGVVDDNTEAYKWQTRKAVTEVAGLLGCAPALGPLERSKTEIRSLGLTPEQSSNFEKAVDRAIERIKASQHRRTQWN